MPKRNDIEKVLIIGSGPIVIGQSGEFDCSGTQACKALHRLGCKVVVVNPNPATVMTDPGLAAATYTEPLNTRSIEEIIARERPDAILPSLGGQTGINLSFQLAREGILAKYGVRIIGLTEDALERTGDRKTFADTLARLGIDMPRSETAMSLEDAESILERIDLPCVIRPVYALEGTGGGLVYNLEEFRMVANRSLSASLIGQILIEESVEGWEELELEILRDAKGQKITVCLIENIDPMGVHSGDSFCSIPALTVDAALQKKLQDYSYAIVDAIDVVGVAHIQFAHDPETGRLAVIKINPRASRSSALASKATGIPVAFVSSLLAAGLSLDEFPGSGETSLERYMPHTDYVVIKSARWAFENFKGAEDRLGAQMRAAGEVMGVGKNYKEALQKSIRSLEIGRLGLGFAKDFNRKSLSELMAMLWFPSSERIFIMYEALRKGASVDELNKRTHIKAWFIQQMRELVDLEEKILDYKNAIPPDDLLTKAKRDGFSDGYLAQILEITEEKIRSRRIEIGVAKTWEPIPVSGSEGADCYYSTYNAPEKGREGSPKKVMILGCGPNRIGQGIESDYCCVHAAAALRDLGYETILVNSNPDAVSTDFDTSDRLYIEPLTLEDVLSIYQHEKPEGVLIQFGGETPLKLCRDLRQAGVRILGISSDVFDLAEDRNRFRDSMQKLGIPQPASGVARNAREASDIAGRIGFPLMVKPSGSLSGCGAEILHDKEDLTLHVGRFFENQPERTILIDKLLQNALEVEVDAISDGTDVFIPSIMEHIELAGIHPGDAACVLPPVSISEQHCRTIEEYTKKIAAKLKILGLINIRYAIADDRVILLEVNPHSSRTVPLVSRVCNIPMARLATRLVMGGKLKDLDLSPKKILYHGVKESVFPFNTFYEVDPILGPEMRSTGEVLGLADSFELAFYRAQEAARQLLPQAGCVLFSVSDSEKEEAVAVAREFTRLGFKLKATEGTQKYLADSGVESEKILKVHAGRPNITDAIKNGEIQLVINTPIGKRSAHDDSYIRKTAIKYKIPYATTIAAARAAAKGIAAYRRKGSNVISLQEYYAGTN